MNIPNPSTVQQQLDKLLRDVSTISLGAASKRAPYTIDPEGNVRIVTGGLRTWSQTITVPTAAAVDTLCQFSQDTLIHFFLARCSDAQGLNAFRFALTDENNKLMFVDRYEIKTQGSQTAPLAAHTVLASADGMDTRPSMGLYLPKETKFYTQVTDAYGTPSYTVDLTCVYQALAPVRK